MNERLVHFKSPGGYRLAAYYQESGEDLVLFLHGLGCGKTSFSPVFSDTRFKPFSLLAIDCLGFGDSDKPEAFSYAVDEHATQIAGVLEQIPFKRLHIVAHSFGNAVALKLPQNVLQRCRSFVNSEGNLIPDDCGLISRRVSRFSFEQFERLLLPQLLAEVGYFEFDRMLPYAFWRSAISLVAVTDSGVLLDAFLNLECRREYFFGEKNRTMKVLRLLEGIPKCEIADSGHFMSADNPTQFYEEVLRVLHAATESHGME